MLIKGMTVQANVCRLRAGIPDWQADQLTWPVRANMNRRGPSRCWLAACNCAAYRVHLHHLSLGESKRSW